MTPELWSIVAFVAIFIFGTSLNVNLGVLAFTAVFLLAATVADVPMTEIYTFFPGDIFILLFGMLLLLSLVKAVGVLDWLVTITISSVRGRLIFIPWVLFALAAGSSAIGPGAMVLLAGIGVSFARQYNISRLLLALMIIHGSQAGGLSPVKPYSVVVRGIVEKAGFEFDPMVLFAGGFVYNSLAALVGFTVLGGWKLMRRTESVESFTLDIAEAPGNASITGHNASGQSSRPIRTGAPITPTAGSGSRTAGLTDTVVLDDSFSTTSTMPPDRNRTEILLRLAMLAAILTLIVGTGFLKWDLGATAIVVATALAFLIPAKRRAGILENISWSVVVLLAGMFTFMALLEHMGTIDFIVAGLQSLGSVLLALLVICYISGMVSAVASSFATVAATLPMAMAIIQGTPLATGLGATLVATAIVVASTIVDISPFSTMGALVLGAAEPHEQNAFQRILLKYAGAIVVLAPGAAWVTLILPLWVLA